MKKYKELESAHQQKVEEFFYLDTLIDNMTYAIADSKVKQLPDNKLGKANGDYRELTFAIRASEGDQFGKIELPEVLLPAIYKILAQHRTAVGNQLTQLERKLQAVEELLS